MATLHTALKSLGPVSYSDVPTAEPELKPWLSDLFTQAQLVLDSIPIVEPSESSAGPRTSSSSIASDASEISVSSVRSPPPAPDHQVLQKEWGKPVKLGAKETALGMSVYKLSGKDGKGAWFARRSVHEGLSFPRFRKALEMEFPESLAVQGAPGEGNVRGIGGETKVEDIKVPSKGRVEVYRLSAQFPGPTTPRDFVTLLVTSDNAMQPPKVGEPVLRHYMIISKPCDHPETQPQSGFIRGNYESVEFIRELPRQTKMSQSTSDVPKEASHQSHQDDVGRDAMIRNATQKTKTSAVQGDIPGSGDTGEVGRKRSSTAPEKPPMLQDNKEPNPVEWIMVTRSDPGGSVPRFMVERGTPGSICADAEKFLDWACKQNFQEDEVAEAKDVSTRPGQERRESFQSFRSSRLAGVEGQDRPTSKLANEEQSPVERGGVNEGKPAGIFGTAAQYLSSYTPQVVLDHLPRNDGASSETSQEETSPPAKDDDATSIASFESADSHLDTSGSEAASPTSSRLEMPVKSDKNLSHHEKELRKLEQRRADLENKFSESRTKLEQDMSTQTTKETQAKQKAIEKHEKEIKKHQEKYEKELKKLNEKHEKEQKKMEAQKKKQADKDEKSKLTRERDEARQELEIAKKEATLLRSSIEDLQRQNTVLVAKLGKAGLSDEISSDDVSTMSRQASRREKGHKSASSTSTSIKSQ